jgi:hypothetical protein
MSQANRDPSPVERSNEAKFLVSGGLATLANRLARRWTSASTLQ